MSDQPPTTATTPVADTPGVLVETDPIFTAEQIREDGRTRVAKTGGQVGGSAALVGLGQALCQSRGWLHGELSPIVFSYWVTIVTIAAAAVTNISRLRGKT